VVAVGRLVKGVEEDAAWRGLVPVTGVVDAWVKGVLGVVVVGGGVVIAFATMAGFVSWVTGGVSSTVWGVLLRSLCVASTRPAVPAPSRIVSNATTRFPPRSVASSEEGTLTVPVVFVALHC
jgi:hypothetical protein